MREIYAYVIDRREKMTTERTTKPRVNTVAAADRKFDLTINWAREKYAMSVDDFKEFRDEFSDLADDNDKVAELFDRFMSIIKPLDANELYHVLDDYRGVVEVAEGVDLPNNYAIEGLLMIGEKWKKAHKNTTTTVSSSAKKCTALKKDRTPCTRNANPAFGDMCTQHARQPVALPAAAISALLFPNVVTAPGAPQVETEKDAKIRMLKEQIDAVNRAPVTRAPTVAPVTVAPAVDTAVSSNTRSKTAALPTATLQEAPATKTRKSGSKKDYDPVSVPVTVVKVSMTDDTSDVEVS